MIKDRRRNGFTLVELVIVIAVIAILAGVLIPTFGSIVDKAYGSQDTVLVSNINNIVALEKVMTGDPNDAIELQKVIKSYNLKLETKTKGKYLWYDIDNHCVVLAGLNENGIDIEQTATAQSESPTKGQFKEATTPENFVEGYLFITEQSRDGLADAIYALRNPDGRDSAKKLEALAKALEKIEATENYPLYNTMRSLMARTAVMTEAGTIFSGDASAVTRIIVSTEMETVTKEAIDGLKSRFPNIIVVDFHSEVKDITSDAVNIIKSGDNEIFFVYNNEEIEKIDHADGGDIPRLITKDERGQFINTLNLVFVDKASGTELSTSQVSEFLAGSYNITYPFARQYYYNGSQAYDFVAYSLYRDGSYPIPVGSSGYLLKDDEKLLIDDQGNLNIYVIFESSQTHFLHGNRPYSSKEMTNALANGEITSGTITVVSTSATLDASLIGKTSAELTLKSGVELLLPWKDDHSKHTQVFTDNPTYSEISDLFNTDYNKDTMTGKTQLNLKNVNLTVESGASIYVDASLCFDYGGFVQSFITNNCGVLVINQGSSITSYGDIKSYGIIRGSGTIDAKGGTVTEVMTICDWYGGQNAAVAAGAGGIGGLAGLLTGENYDGKGVTPFNSWKIEHIRAKMIIHSGATYKAEGRLNVGDGVTVPFALVSKDAGQNPLLQISEDAEIERSVSADGDIKITLKKGTANDLTKKMKIEKIISGMGEVNLDFSVLAMPFSHFDLIVESGTTLTLSGNIYKVLPGSDIIVNEGGVLNVNTEVVVCNSFDLIFKEKAAEKGSAGLSNSKSDSTFEVIAGGKQMKVTLTNYTRKNILSSWKVSSVTESIDSIVITYPIQTPANFIVNGTLNFGSGAAFAGNIKSERTGAVINVNTNLSGHTIKEGFRFHRGETGQWYDTYDPNLYTTPVLNGTAHSSLASGTSYKFVSGSQGGVVINGWQQQ